LNQYHPPLLPTPDSGTNPQAHCEEAVDIDSIKARRYFWRPGFLFAPSTVVNLDDNALIALIQEKIAAEQSHAAEAKRLADAQIEANQLVRRERDRDNRRTGQWADTVQRYAELGERVKDLLAEFEIGRKEREAQKSIDREFHNTLSERVDDLEQGIYAILTRDLAEMRRSRGKIGTTIDRRAELQTLYRNLSKLREQAARYGPDVPLSVQNGIEETERKIEEIKGA
jgi:hypothetical protein